MIDLEFLERLIRAFDESGVDSLELERGGTRIRLAKTPPAAAVEAPVPTTAPAPAAGSAAPPAPLEAVPSGSEAAPARLVDVTCPMVGTFFRAPAPDAPPYVDVGSRVSKGDTLCVIEAMKLMNELESELPGTVVEICVENAQPVEYGQLLFRIDPT